MKNVFVPAKRVGKLHENLGISPDKKIGKARLQKAKNSKSPLIRKEANEAINMQKGRNSK
jgi:hypothetical protein